MVFGTFRSRLTPTTREVVKIRYIVLCVQSAIIYLVIILFGVIH